MYVNTSIQIYMYIFNENEIIIRRHPAHHHHIKMVAFKYIVMYTQFYMYLRILTNLTKEKLYICIMNIYIHNYIRIFKLYSIQNNELFVFGKLKYFLCITFYTKKKKKRKKNTK